MRAIRTATTVIAVVCLAPFGLGCDSSGAACGSADGQAPDGQPTDAASADVTVTDGEAGSFADAGPAEAAQAPSDAAGGTEAPASTLAWVRLANWSPDAPAVDFCLAPHGTAAFGSPLVASLAASTMDAGATPLAYPLATAYFAMKPGAYDARIVVAGAGSCAVGIGTDMTMLPALAANGFSTIALVGEELPSGGDPGLQVVGFKDSTSPSAGVSLRFINASPLLGTVDFGTGTATGTGSLVFKALFTGVLFGQAGKPLPTPPCASAAPDASAPPDASTAPTAGAAPDASTSPDASASLDAGGPSDGSAPSPGANGYETVCKLSNVLSAHDPRAGVDAVATMMPVAAAPGSVLTVVLVGGTSGGAPPRLLECVDNAGTVGELGNCCGIGSSVGPAGVPTLAACPQ